MLGCLRRETVMADYHLNSMHLEAPRREEFRQARARLLDALGDLTRLADQGAVPSPTDSRTIIQELEERMPPGMDYVLMDKDNLYPLKVGLNTIGRLPDNDVVLEDPYVSRRHCAVLIHASRRSELHDVASKNGTYLNGAKITGPVPLSSGDEVRLCERQLVFISKADLDKVPGHAATLPR
jgi:FHA domain